VAGAGTVSITWSRCRTVDAQDRVVDFDGDDVTGVAQPDSDTLADDLGAAA
jgi:hypothetical protein